MDEIHVHLRDLWPVVAFCFGVIIAEHSGQSVRACGIIGCVCLVVTFLIT